MSPRILDCWPLGRAGALGWFKIWIACLVQGSCGSFHFRGLQSINSDSDKCILPYSHKKTTRVWACLSEHSGSPLCRVHPLPGSHMGQQAWCSFSSPPPSPHCTSPWPATLQSNCRGVYCPRLTRQNKGPRARWVPFGVRDNFRAQMEKEKKKGGLKSIAGFYQTRTCSSQLTISQQLNPTRDSSSSQLLAGY